MIPIEFSLFFHHFRNAVFPENEKHVDLAEDKEDIHELMFKIPLTISMFLPHCIVDMELVAFKLFHFPFRCMCRGV